jgi:hypothetical protein
MNSVFGFNNNPVYEFYDDYKLPLNVPVLRFGNYTELLDKLPSVSENCILLTDKTQSVQDTKIVIDANIGSNLKVYVVLNITLHGTSTLEVNGSNFALCNISIEGGDSKSLIGDHFVKINASKLTLVNFSIVNVRCKNKNIDFFRVYEDATDFSMHNSLFDGKYVTGVFARLDFPKNYLIKHCVFRNFPETSSPNGGETIRMATSAFEKDDAFCTIDSCFFENCEGDPETVSVKCSSNTIRNCVFDNRKRLVLRHGNSSTVENCIFIKSGIRVYGSNHVFRNIQLQDDANILLDNKSGSSYEVATNCLLENIFFVNVSTPITDNGKSNKVGISREQQHITKESMFKLSTPTKPIEIPKSTSTTTQTSEKKFTLFKSGIRLRTMQIQAGEKFAIEYTFKKNLRSVNNFLTFKIVSLSSNQVIFEKREVFDPKSKALNANLVCLLGTSDPLCILSDGIYKIEIVETGDSELLYVGTF